MSAHANKWALVLAAGDGTRLRGLTTTSAGANVPKQFCSLRGGFSLFHEAAHRAHSIVSRAHTCAIVASHHQIWWQSLPRALPINNLIVQPRNRGTANGVLLPLLHILARDPQAHLVLLPSDHYVREEPVLARSLDEAMQQLRERPENALLLGFEPRQPDEGLGYIVPGISDGLGALHVEQFVEKPPLAQARQIVERGGLWNAFIVVAGAQGLLNLFQRRIPDVVEQMRAAVTCDLGEDQAAATRALYERLPTIDFSRDILQGQERFLRVLPVPDCGWSDLGTPRGVENVLRQSPRSETPLAATLDCSHLSLATQYELHQLRRGQKKYAHWQGQ
jgi:mannose-1-phosphate guanylyltransferase